MTPLLGKRCTDKPGISLLPLLNCIKILVQYTILMPYPEDCQPYIRHWTSTRPIYLPTKETKRFNSHCYRPVISCSSICGENREVIFESRDVCGGQSEIHTFLFISPTQKKFWAEETDPGNARKRVDNVVSSRVCLNHHTQNYIKLLNSLFQSELLCSLPYVKVLGVGKRWSQYSLSGPSAETEAIAGFFWEESCNPGKRTSFLANGQETPSGKILQPFSFGHLLPIPYLFFFSPLQKEPQFSIFPWKKQWQARRT